MIVLTIILGTMHLTQQSAEAQGLYNKYGNRDHELPYFEQRQLDMLKEQNTQLERIAKSLESIERYQQLHS
jgi:hypothetical protein